MPNRIFDPTRRLGALCTSTLFVLLPTLGCTAQEAEPSDINAGVGGSTTSVGGSPAAVGGSAASATGAGGMAGTQGFPTGAGGVLISSTGGTAGAGGSGGNCEPGVIGLLRDFTRDHPNFQFRIGAEEGIVLPDLGPDKKPVFSGARLETVTTAEDFDQWYRDVPGVNETFEHTLPFVTSATGTAVYDDTAFFPLDDRGFGNEGNDHNFHFTFELHMRFRYEGGETFTFRGDDDVFVFINDKLALDLGGVHAALESTIDLDAQAVGLGISPGNEYDIDMFHAERHTSESNFRVETNLLFTNCEPIIVR